MNTVNYKRDLQAKRWFERLQAVDVSEQELKDFDCWISDEHNKKAYKKTESVVDMATAFSNDPTLFELSIETNARLEKQAKKKKSRSIPAMLSSLVAVVVTVMIVVSYLSEPSAQVFHSKVGEQQSIQLNDNIHIHLNTGTQVKALLSSNASHIDLLQGQILLDVSTDADPILIQTNSHQIKINSAAKIDITYLENRPLSVRLMKGQANIQQPSMPQYSRIIKEGQILLAEKDFPPLITSSKTFYKDDWLSGELNFEQTPLGEAVYEFNRYNKQKINFIAHKHKDMPISGRIVQTDIEQFIYLIQSQYPELSITKTDKQVNVFHP